LIKLYPVLLEAKSRGYAVRVVASGQNDISQSYFLKAFNGGVLDIDLCPKPPVIKSALAKLKWFLTTETRGVRVLKQHFESKNLSDIFFVIHGDTLSTVMGARLAKKLGLRFGHIEAGYRSFNWLCPFPEEIDRYYGSLHSVLNFSPGEGPTANLRNNRGRAVDTKFNTIIETLDLALNAQQPPPVESLKGKKYFVFVFHRQENLLNQRMCEAVIPKIQKLAEKIHCLFLYHDYTRARLSKLGLFQKLLDDRNVTASPRLGYFDFIKVVSDAEFVVTDGAGNQQEMFYLGKPCLLLRNKIDGTEGMGLTTKLYNGEFDSILRFYDEYPSFRKERTGYTVKPSAVIMDAIDRYAF
jgi:UDP-N-acetylglucosamine 2-epimerase (non-hydrolysing)